MTLYTVALS